MINVKQSKTAIIYVLLIIIMEVILYYAAVSMPSIADFAMLGTLVVFIGVAWVLKPKLNTLLVAATLIIVYGVVSFYLKYPIYHTGYPLEFQEFLQVIGIKTAFYSFPLIAYIVFNKK